MPRAVKKTERSTRRRAPALTPEDREDQLISLAIDVAEQQLRDGTASAQVITHYLKLGSTKERLEKEKLRRENILLSAKADSIRSEKDVQNLYRNAIDAFRSYRSSVQEADDSDEDY